MSKNTHMHAQQVADKPGTTGNQQNTKRFATETTTLRIDQCSTTTIRIVIRLGVLALYHKSCVTNMSRNLFHALQTKLNGAAGTKIT